MSSISAGTTTGTALVQTGDTTGNLVIKTGANATTALTISGTDQSITVAGGLNLGTPIPATSGGTGLNSAGTSGNVLTSNGSAWVSQAAAAFDSGTVMLFAQTSAPTGWTKDSSNYNNSALRVVTGSASTGGSVDFTTAFASQSVSGTVGTSGATTLSTSEIPSHTHTITLPNWNADSITSWGVSSTGISNTSVTSSSTGGGGSHTHSGGTFTGTAINLAVKYVDVIRATKN